MSSPTSLEIDLTWLGDQRFGATVGSSPSAAALTLDGAGAAGPSPVAALGAALAGCMAIDLVHILGRGRHRFEGVKAHLHAERAETEPRRLVRVTLHFVVTGRPPREAVDRAIALSRDRYCSVWHSLRPDIDFQVTFALAD